MPLTLHSHIRRAGHGRFPKSSPALHRPRRPIYFPIYVGIVLGSMLIHHTTSETGMPLSAFTLHQYFLIAVIVISCQLSYFFRNTI